MEHKITYKKPDGTLQETMFNDFDQFADSIDQVAQEYYAGMRPTVEVETIYNDGFIQKERVTNHVESRDSNGTEFLSE